MPRPESAPRLGRSEKIPVHGATQTWRRHRSQQVRSPRTRRDVAPWGRPRKRLPDVRGSTCYLSPYTWALQPHGKPKASVEFAPPVAPVAALTCPQFCECAGSPFVGSAFSVASLSSVYHCRSSCPEKAHGELPLTGFSFPLPVISPAKAALAPRARTVAAANALTNSRIPSPLVSWAPGTGALLAKDASTGVMPKSSAPTARKRWGELPSLIAGRPRGLLGSGPRGRSRPKDPHRHGRVQRDRRGHGDCARSRGGAGRRRGPACRPARDRGQARARRHRSGELRAVRRRSPWRARRPRHSRQRRRPRPRACPV